MFTPAVGAARQSLRAGKLDTETSSSGAPRRVLTLVVQVLLFAMMAFPSADQLLYVKASLFALVLFLVGFRALTEARLALHPTVGAWALFLSAVGLCFVIRGFQNGTPGAAHAAQVYVLWPLVYTVLITGFTNWRMFVWAQRVLVFAAIFVALHALSFALTELGVLPGFMYVELFEQGQRIGAGEGYTRMNVYALDSMPFLLPFAMAALATYSRVDKPKAVAGKWLWLAVGAGLGLTLVSARRGLILAAAAAPLFIFVFRPLRARSTRPMRKKFLVLAALVPIVVAQWLYLESVFDFRAARFVEFFVRGFDFRQAVDLGAYERREQFSALVAGWTEHPLVGAGLGAVAPGVVRDFERPWSYELYYLALLYHVGLVGMLAYSASVAWIYWTGIKVVKEGGTMGNTMLSLLVGLTCFLMVNGTNPILPRFDGMWVIFLPLALINFWLRNRPKKCAG